MPEQSGNEEQYSNFGMAPQRHVKAAKLDSLIFINDSVTIMVTSWGHIMLPWRRDTNDLSYAREMGLWEPGRDTVTNHPLFTLLKSKKEIKATIQKDYHFINSVDSIKFIYQGKSTSKKQLWKAKKMKNFVLPQWVKDNPSGLLFIFLIAGLFFTFYKRKSLAF